MEEALIKEYLEYYRGSRLISTVPEQGMRIAIIYTPDLQNNFQVSAFLIENCWLNKIGSYEGQEDSFNEHRQKLSTFLDLSSIKNPTPFYMSNVEIKEEFRGKGLSRLILDAFTSELSRRQAAHIVRFTSSGIERIKQKYIDKGYARLPMINGCNGCKNHEEYGSLDEWMFYDYEPQHH
jgi:hypothetical protein